VQSAIQVYNQTMALPQTATEAMLNFEGYVLNGLWQLGNENLLVCFKGTVTHMLKALTQKEISRASSLLTALTQQNQTNPYLTSFELRSHEKKVFMIMPFYSSTLEIVRKISLADGVRLFDQVGSAINYLHSLNFNHMDIKPAKYLFEREW
jgi:serine/threonine protein kinase